MTKQTAAPRRGRPPDVEARARVLAIAEELLDDPGYLAFTVDELATRARVSKKTLYRWWPSKAAVAAEVLAKRSPVHPVPDVGDTRAELLTVFRLGCEYAEGRELPTGIVVAEDPGGKPELLHNFTESVIAPRRDVARAAVQRGIARGDLPADIDVDTLLDLWSGFAVYRKAIRPAPLAERTGNQLVDLALAGHVPRLG